MKAQIGDRIVVAPLAVGGAVRDGEVIEVRGRDGAPPYLVRWGDDGHEGLYFPGVDAHVEGIEGSEGTADQPETGAPAAHPAGPRHVRSWTVTIDLFEDGRDTSAHAVLRTEAPQHLDAHGAAHRRPSDPDVPEIGDEIAVARALRHLADRLLGTAADDIVALEGEPVSLHET